MRRLIAAAITALALLLAAGHSGAQNIPSLRSLSPSLVIKNPSAPTIQFFSSVLDKTGLSTWTAVAGDATRTIKVGNASPYTLSFPSAATLGPGWGACYQNTGSVPVAVTAAGSLFEGAGGLAKLTLMPDGWICPRVDGANYATPNEDGAAASCQSIVNYGGSGDGTTDNLAPWNAFAAAPLAAPCISFPPILTAGKYYNFTGPANYSIPSGSPLSSLAIRGAGADLSVLRWATGNGLAITENSAQQSVHIAGVSIATGAASSATVGLTLTQAVVTNSNPADTPQSDLTDVTLRGDNGVLDTSKYWGTAIVVNEVSHVKYGALNIYGGAQYQDTLPGSGGDGIVLNGSATNFSVVHDFNNLYLLNLLHGIIYNNYVQGVTLTQPDVQGGYEGVYVPPGQLGLAQLTITGGEFTVGGAALDIQSVLPETNVTGTLLLIKDAGSVGVNIAAMQAQTLFNGVGFFGLVPPGFFTGSIGPASTTMTVTAITAGTSIAAGATVGNLGPNPVASGTTVLAYGTGGTTGTGGLGTYALSGSAQTVASEQLQSHSGTGIQTQAGTVGGQVLASHLTNLAVGANLAAGSFSLQGNFYAGVSQNFICGAGDACENANVATLGPGLASQPMARNTGTQTTAQGGVIYLQTTLVPKTANYTLNADFGGTTDTAAYLVATGSTAITFAAPAPGINGTTYPMGDGSGHGFTVTTPSGTFYGCPGSSGASLVVAPNSDVAIRSDGANYKCTIFGGNFVSGPGSSVNSDVAIFNGAGGALLADSGLLIADVATTNTTQTLSGKSIDASEVNTGVLAAAQMLPLATGGVYLGNGSNQPASSTLSAALDAAFGATRGSLLERTGGAWVLLTPGATAGAALVTNGVGADPSYQLQAITLGSGLASNLAARNVGAQIAASGATVNPQLTVVPKTASYVVNADNGGVTDTAALLLANGTGSITFTAPNPTANGTRYRFGDASGHGYTLATVGGTKIFYGCSAGGGTTLVVPANAMATIYDDGGNYQCALASGSFIPTIASSVSTDVALWNGGAGNALADSGIAAANLVTLAATQTLSGKSISGASNTLSNIALASLAAEAANTVVGALTATTPSALPMPSCTGSTNALLWASGTGFGCNSTVLPSALASGQIFVGSAGNVATGVAPSGGIASISNAGLVVISGAELLGTATNDNASAGNVGEYPSSSIAVGSAVAFVTTNTPVNVTSLNLTAGDWQVCGKVLFAAGASTLQTEGDAGINTVSATLPTAPAGGYVTTGTTGVAAAGVQPSLTLDCVRESLASTTLVYLVANAKYTVSTDSAYGFLGARRVR